MINNLCSYILELFWAPPQTVFATAVPASSLYTRGVRGDLGSFVSAQQHCQGCGGTPALVNLG